jgi:hypothetical protein
VSRTFHGEGESSLLLFSFGASQASRQPALQGDKRETETKSKLSQLLFSFILFIYITVIFSLNLLYDMMMKGIEYFVRGFEAKTLSLDFFVCLKIYII